MKNLSLLLVCIIGLLFVSCKKEKEQVETEIKTGVLKFQGNFSEDTEKMKVKSEDEEHKYFTKDYVVEIIDTKGFIEYQKFEDVDLESTIEIKYTPYSIVNIYYKGCKETHPIKTFKCLYDRRNIKLSTNSNGDLTPIVVKPYSIAVRLKVIDTEGNNVPRTEYVSFLKNTLYSDIAVHHDFLNNWIYLNVFNNDIKYFYRVCYRKGEICKDYPIGNSWKYDSNGNIIRGVATTITTGIDFKGDGTFNLEEIK